MKGRKIMPYRFLSIILILCCCIAIFSSCAYIEEGINRLKPEADFGAKDGESITDPPQSEEPFDTPISNGDINDIDIDIEQTIEEEPIVDPPEEDSTEEEPQEDTIITISLAGDCTIGTDETFTYTNSFPDRLKKVEGDWSYFFAGVKDIFENDDLTLVNLETTFTTATKKAEKKYRFKGDPSYVNILKEGSVEMVNVSNNHIYDYLQRGFDDTLETLEQAGVLYSGEGHIAFFETKGITIASLGYQGWNTNIKKQIKKDIEEVRDKASLIIVSFHWGIERDNYPNSVQKELGRFAIDEGADIVAGHHPHVVQGIEEYKDRYIIYSLGNFCFGGNRNPGDKDSFIFQNQFVFSDGEIKESQGKIIPCSVSSVKNVNDYQPTVLEGDEAQRVMNRIMKYSNSLEYAIAYDW